ncbi:MAG: RING finger protein, partial [Candidatus Hodarchaeota archaeon]
TLAISFLIILSRTPIHWKQFGVKIDLLEVYLPERVGDLGFITARTTNRNPIGVSQIQMKVLDPSPHLQITIEPSNRTFLGPGDTISWFIQFIPKATGMMDFGRIALRLADNLVISSRMYYLRVQEKPSFSQTPITPSQPEIIDDISMILDPSGKCGICRQNFHASDFLSFCRFCGSLFHRSHLQEWLKNHQTCPNCTRPIKVSEEEKNYLQIVLGRLKKLEDESKRLRNLLERSEEPIKDFIGK